MTPNNTTNTTNANVTLSNGPDGINGSVTPDSFAPTPTPAPTPAPGPSPNSTISTTPSPAYQKIGWASREKSRNMAKYNYFDNLGKFFKNFNAGQKLSGGYANIHLFDQNFKLLQVLNIGTMIPNMKIDMGEIPAE